MFVTELSWEFMRDLGLVVFGVGGALVAFGFSFSRILVRELGPPNVTLMTTIGDAMMLAGGVPSSNCYRYWVFDACGASVRDGA